MKITLDLSPKTKAYMDELLETEVYGETLEDVALSLLREGIIEKIHKGIIRRKDFSSKETPRRKNQKGRFSDEK